MSQPFHFAFFVRDLAATRRFYGEILGCREGRGTDTWVDFDFFGNQISAHASGPVVPTTDAGVVDGIRVPMPHFGAVLAWDEFHRVAERIRQGLKHVPAEKLVVAPDCGMKYLDRATAFGKLVALTKGAALVRRELA